MATAACRLSRDKRSLNQRGVRPVSLAAVTFRSCFVLAQWRNPQTQMEEPTQMSTLSAVHETINVPRKVSWSGFLLSLLAGAIACSTSYAGPNGMSTNGAEAMALAEAGEIDAND